MPKAIGYMRCSTQEQADSGLGLDAQAERIRPYAALKGLDLDIVTDADTGKQKRCGRSFRQSRDAKSFLIEKQHQPNEGVPQDLPIDVTLGRVLVEFEETRLASLSYASQIGYSNTTTQLLEYFGRTRKVRAIQQRHAEAFLASRKRCDGRPGELSSWSKARHLIHCRAMFAAIKA